MIDGFYLYTADGLLTLSAQYKRGALAISPAIVVLYSLAKCIWIGQLLVEGFSSDGHRSVETNFRNRLFSNNLVWNCNSKAVRNADSTRDCSKNSDLAKSFRI
jgi:hypothetical protein